MRNKIIVYFLFSICFSSFAQVQLSLPANEAKKIITATKKDTIDICKLRVHYRMEYIKNIEEPTKKTHYYMLLQIGKNSSKFSDFARLTADSLIDIYAKQKKSEAQCFNKMLPYYQGTSPLNVYKNYPTGKITVIDRASFAGSFKYSEDNIKLNWKMQQGTSKICGYSCKKATTSFRGRNYAAWYAPNLAYSDGPWKFSGLPGLILKVTDDKNEYSFECVVIEKAMSNEYIYFKYNDFINTTREKFNETAKKVNGNPTPYIEMRGIKQPVQTKKTPYNPIELQ